MVILIICFLSALIYFGLYLFMKPSKWRVYLGWISMLICVVSLILSMLNINEHFGMISVDTVKTERLTPINNQNKIIVKDNKVEYATQEGKTKLDCLKKNVRITKKTQNAFVISIHSTWQFKNDFWKFLFQLPNQNYSQTKGCEFYLPSDWQVEK